MNEGCSLNQKMDSSNRLFFVGERCAFVSVALSFLASLYIFREKKKAREIVFCTYQQSLYK